MNENDQRGLRIHFTDGTSLVVRFPRQLDNKYAQEIAREAILEQRMLMIEADGGVHFIPFENIKYFTLWPAPPELGKNVIRGATVGD